MKFSTTTITTFALVAISGLCTIPSSVEAFPFNSGYGNDEVELKAEIDSAIFKGTVTVTQKQRKGKAKQITDAKWVIDIDRIDDDICINACRNAVDPPCTVAETKLNWHVHERAIPEDGSCGDTGGHWDPTFGCGGASQYQGEGDWCELLVNATLPSPFPSAITGRVNPQTCEPKEDITKCEMGDLSSKMKQVRIRRGTQRFYDEYISNLDNIKDLSIVFHCGKPRVACGNFVLIEE